MARSTAKFTISAEDKTTAALKSAMSGIDKLKGHFMSLAAPIAGLTSAAGLGMLIEKTRQTGDMFDKMSLRIGVSVEELSAISYASQIAGTDITMMEKSLRYLSDKMLEVKRGTGEARQTFEELGIEVMDSNGKFKSLTGMLVEIADKVSALEDETLKAAYASDISVPGADRNLYHY